MGNTRYTLIIKINQPISPVE